MGSSTRSCGGVWSRNAGLAVSALLHLGLLICAMLLLGPLRQGRDGPLEFTLAVNAEEPLPEMAELILPEVGVPVVQPAVIQFEQTVPAPLVAPSPRPLRAASRLNGSGAATGSGPRGTFFGTVAQGNRLIYVLDVSGSMNEMRDPTKNATRLHCAMEELLASVERLAPDQYFYVVLFCDKTRLMFDERSLLPELIPATPENKRRLFEWLLSVRAGDGTDPRAAIHFALKMQPSAVFLLSDGEFNGSKNRNNAGVLYGNPSVKEVVSSTSDQRTPIHTIAYEEAGGAEKMKSLAGQTGGEFRFIPPLPNSRKTRLSDMGRKERLEKKRVAHLSRKLLAKAIALDKKGEYRSAAKRYRSVLDRFPNTEAAGEAEMRLQRKSSTQLVDW